MCMPRKRKKKNYSKFFFFFHFEMTNDYTLIYFDSCPYFGSHIDNISDIVLFRLKVYVVIVTGEFQAEQ